jgi:hypothetical protein
MNETSKNKENIQSNSVRGNEHFVSLKKSVVSTKLYNVKVNNPTVNWYYRISDGISGVSYKPNVVITGLDSIYVSNLSSVDFP